MFTTACYKDEVDFLVDELKIDSIKINSSDISQLSSSAMLPENK